MFFAVLFCFIITVNEFHFENDATEKHKYEKFLLLTAELEPNGWPLLKRTKYYIKLNTDRKTYEYSHAPQEVGSK